MSSDALVLGFADYADQARRLADAAGLAFDEIGLHHFPDGESLVRLPETVPDHVIVCCTLNHANRQLVELALAAATARRLGARRVTLVAPYLCYMRQDSAFHPGEAISQPIIGDLIAHRFDTLVTVDPHLHRTKRLEAAVPVSRAIAISAAPLMADWLAGRDGQPLLVGPDEESSQWVARIAQAADLEGCVAHKERRGDRDVIIALPDVDFGGRDVVLVDDVVSTGHTLAAAARLLLDRGAASVSVLVSHALFVTGAMQALKAAGVGEIVSTDSIPHESNRLALAELLAGALE